MTQTLRRELRQKTLVILNEHYASFSVKYNEEIADKLADAVLEVAGIAKQEVVVAANKKVDAILEQARQAETRLNYPQRESLPEPIRELIDVFVEETKIKPLKKQMLDWLSAAQDWLNIGATAEDIRQTIRLVNHAIYRPGSITAAIQAYKAGTLIRNGKPNEPIAFEAIRQAAAMNGVYSG